MERQIRRTTQLLVAAITLLAFGLRTWQLDAQSLWYDEGVTVEIAQRGFEALTRWTADDIQPPLYYYVISAWGALAGWSEWSLRFPSVFFGTLLVPLMAAVATALARRRVAGVLAALFVACHPLLVYYSQEARMYAMLTALCALLGYIVVRRAWASGPGRLSWAAYVLVATAAVYTHYFAFFLIIALAIAFLIDQLLRHFHLRQPPTRGVQVVAGDASLDSESEVAWESESAAPQRAQIIYFLLANLAVLLLYLPWFAALFNRLSVDTSYWQGRLKIDEALRHVGISFTSGETVLEGEATQLLWLYAGITLIALAALIFRRPPQYRTLHYSLLWFILPIVGILLLASVVPKFNARYVMVALPGLLLAWSAGLAAMFTIRPRRSRLGVYRPRLNLPLVLATVCIVAILLGFNYANRNWFVDPAFTKAQWRELAQHLRGQQVEGDDATAVVLLSGHAWPVWNYYAPEMQPLRLPDLEILDVNAVLDFASSAFPLRDALVGKETVWLVEWQDEIVDPMNIVPLQLQIAGRREQVDERFWQLELQHYTSIDSDEILVEPTRVSESSVNFGNQLYLLDYTVADNGDLLLFWQLLPETSLPDADLHITGETSLASGIPYHRLNDRRPASYEYPSFRWLPGQITLGRVRADNWAGPGALPGDYRFRLGVYDLYGDLSGFDIIGEQGQLRGKQISLDLTLPVATEGSKEFNRVSFAYVADDLLAEVNLSSERAEPGQDFALDLHWYAEDDLNPDYSVLSRWTTRDSGETLTEEILPLSPLFPTSQWPKHQLFRSVFALAPPSEAPPGDYWLDVGVVCNEDTACEDEEKMSTVQVPFRILESSRIFAPPPYFTDIAAEFGEQLKLLGMIEPVQLHGQPGQQAAFTLVWQAIEAMPADYTATIQWLSADGLPAAQTDLALPGGSSTWLPGQVELQSVFATLPEEPGEYRLIIAAYDAEQANFPRLPTRDGQDLVELGIVTVDPAE